VWDREWPSSTALDVSHLSFGWQPTMRIGPFAPFYLELSGPAQDHIDGSTAAGSASRQGVRYFRLKAEDQGMSDFNRQTTAEEVSAGIDLTGRHAIVTGANTGIGRETARVLALRGASVTMACRDLEKASVARDAILASNSQIGKDQLEVMRLDLGQLDQIRDFARNFLATSRPIHLLINNAGVMLPDRRETADGFEAHFGVNHLGHFLLTRLLEERVRASAPARIVNVSSDALHFSSLTESLEDLNWESRSFSGWRSYGDSKLMNVLFTNELNRRFASEGVVSNALHPGIVKTELARDQPWWMAAVGLLMLPISKTPEQGAATSVYLATAEEFGRDGAGYFANCARGRVHRLSGNAQLESALWQRSEELVGL
jgi:NAD(P)-dependent dehydrogenase (short-subunit alcohol dehydrogenase family)